MTTVYPVSTQLTSYEVDSDELMQSVKNIAGYTVKVITKKWGIRGPMYREYKDDMFQTAITSVYETLVIDKLEMQKVYKQAQWAVETYVWTLIYGRGAGRSWELSRDVTITSYDEAADFDDDAYTSMNTIEANLMAGGDGHGDISARLLTPIDRMNQSQFERRRPTEEQALNAIEPDTTREEWEQMLDTFEREVIYILTGLNSRNLYPESIVKRARLIRQILDGETSRSLSYTDEQLSLTIKNVSDVRATIKSFLAQSPIMQALIVTEGAIRVHWYEELNEEIINSGERFIVIMPYGAFTVAQKQRAKKSTVINVEKGKSINGKMYRRGVSLGLKGQVTVADLAFNIQRLHDKMIKLEEARC